MKRTSWVLLVGGLLAAGIVQAQFDLDGDGVPDAFDNCLLVGNPGQADSNLDGFGTVCDPDLNDDLLVNTSDLPLLVTSFGDSVPPGSADADLTQDGVVGMPDALVWRSYFGIAPGPSGLSCAGTIPCP